ncbi:MAG: zinc-ribbon domain-containing protein [Pseudomonadota bacterium]
MRLVCPKCGASYAVAAELIPEDGRDVQCASCNHVWFQERVSEEQPALVLQPTIDTSPGLSPEDMGLVSAPADSAEEDRARLRAAVQEELSMQAADAAAAGGGLSAAVAARANAAPQPAADETDFLDDLRAHLREAEKEAKKDRTSKDAPAMRSQKRNVIDAALKAGVDPSRPTRAEASAEARQAGKTYQLDGGYDSTPVYSEPGSTQQARSTRSGFVTAVAIAAAACALYVFKPAISNQVPAVAPYLDQYAERVDTVRIALDRLVASGLGSLQNASEG